MLLLLLLLMMMMMPDGTSAADMLFPLLQIAVGRMSHHASRTI